MDQLNIHLLGAFSIAINDDPPLDPGSPTIRSLLAYLILNRHQPVDRRRLAFQFWPRGTEVAARRNLRQYVHRIRRLLEPVDPEGALIVTEGNNIQFIPPENWFLDAAAFEKAAASITTLKDAINVYQDDLLPEIYDDWIEPERERLSRLYRQSLLRLIDHLQTRGQIMEAIEYAQRYLAVDPLLESAHLKLMNLYYEQGNRLSVKEQYETLQSLLAEELDTEPLPSTTETYHAMMKGEHPLTPSVQAPFPAGYLKITTVDPSSPQLVGRQDELQWLIDAFTQQDTTQDGVYLVQGESGIGKTRLVTEWLSRIQTPIYLFSGRSHEFDQMLSYAPISEALNEGLRQQDIMWDLFHPPSPWLLTLHPIIPELQTHFPELEKTTRSGQYHIVEGLFNFFVTLSLHRPVILFLDNLHWADPLTWNFIGYAAQHAHHSNLMVVITVRMEDSPHENLTLIRSLMRRNLLHNQKLERLARKETEQIVAELMGNDDVDPRFVRRIYEETEGNPFFIIETVRAVRDAGGDWTRSVPTDESGQRPALAIPLEVKAVIQSRLDRLDEESRSALGVAAAIGREFTFELLSEISQMPTEILLDALDEWLNRDIVRETRHGYDFTHEKLGQVAHQQLSRARRQWIHLQIARYLTANQPDIEPGKLAHHYYQSSEPALALPYLIRAGERALSVRSYGEARELGLRAIGLLGRYPALKQSQKNERLELTLQLAQAYAYTGALTRAQEMLQEAERLAEALGDVLQLAWVFHRSARIFWLRGHPQMADNQAQRALRYAEELDHMELRFAALRMLGRCSILLAQYDNAIAYLLRYVDLAEQSVISLPDIPVIYGYLGVAYARVGSWQRAIDAAQRGLDLTNVDLPGSTHVVARMQLAFVYAELNEWKESLSIAEPVRDLWKVDGMVPHLFMLRSVIGLCMVHTGQPDGLEEIEEALAWAKEVDYRVLVHLPRLFLAACFYQTRAYSRGIDAARQVREYSAGIGDSWAEAVALRIQAECEMRLPRPNWEQIEHRLITSRDILRHIRARPALARTYLVLRRLYDRAGQSAWAVDCHFRATTIFTELGMSDELRIAQGQPSRTAQKAVVIPDLNLRGPNLPPRHLDGK